MKPKRIPQKSFPAARSSVAPGGVVYSKTTAPSGLRIVSECLPHLRSVAVGVWINVGSRDETPESSGISHFVEHAVFKGTRRRKSHQIAQYLESVGGYLNAFTTKDSTCYYARVLDANLDRAVDVLADLVLNPAFPARAVENEKQVILEEQRSAEDDAEDIINDYFERQLFGAHPLGMPVLGAPGSIMGIGRDDLERFVAERYAASNIVVTASGAVEHERFVEQVMERFDGIPAGVPTQRRKPGRLVPRHETIRKPVLQTHLVMGCQSPGMRSKHSTAIGLLTTILGDGMSSRLFQRVRERFGYAYNIYSFNTLYEDSGIFGVYAGAENGNIEKVRSIVLRELDDLCKQPGPERELKRAKEQTIGGMILGLESLTNRMQRLGKDELTYGKEIEVEDMIDDIQSVTPEALHSVSAAVCDHTRYTTSTILPPD